MGSLVLGNKATAPGADLDPETARYRRGWKIQVDKVTRYNSEMDEADNIWEEVKNMDYKDMKAKALEKAKKKEVGSSSQPTDPKNASNNKQLLAAKNALINRQHGQQEGQTSEKRLAEMTADEQDRAMLDR
jgi:hypothetical protein